MFVQFSDATATTIIAVFAGPQDSAVYPNLGTVTADDPRWVTFHASLPVSQQAILPAELPAQPAP